VLQSRCDTLIKEREAVQTIMEQKIKVLVQSVAQAAAALTGENPEVASSSSGVALSKDLTALTRLVNASIAALKNAAAATPPSASAASSSSFSSSTGAGAGAGSSAGVGGRSGSSGNTALDPKQQQQQAYQQQAYQGQGSAGRSLGLPTVGPNGAGGGVYPPSVGPAPGAGLGVSGGGGGVYALNGSNGPGRFSVPPSVLAPSNGAASAGAGATMGSSNMNRNGMMLTNSSSSNNNGSNSAGNSSWGGKDDSYSAGDVFRR
jgi:hypothetical protein